MKTRREFLSETFTSISGFGVASALSALGGRLNFGDKISTGIKLVPTKDETTGIKLLHLPEGFRYVTHGWTGDPMSDGFATPPFHDGMGVVSEKNGIATLIRNHEVSKDGKAWPIKNGEPFDPRAMGGCTSLSFDTINGKWLESRVVISGTSRNCAGGVTPWGTWLTAEETVLGVNSPDRYKNNAIRSFRQEHGWGIRG